MEGFLRGLLHTLEQRCAVLGGRCSAVASEIDVRDHALQAYRALERLRRQVGHLLNDPSLGSPLLLSNHLQAYRRWSEEVSQIEGYLLPFIERFDETDRQLTRLCQRLAQQVRWPIDAPLVSAFSSQYYWTVPPFNVIAVPAGETSTLLGLPDLCHEMGHVLLVAYEKEFLTDFPDEIARYIRREKRRVDTERRAPEYKPLYDALLTAWVDQWIWEFLADMIATHLVGLPFGWQHVRLCAGQLGATAYAPTLGEVAGFQHPANEARMRGVRAVLDMHGATVESTSLQNMWEAYVALSGDTQPAEYDVCYPQSLITGLARRAVEACNTLGVRRFDEPSGSHFDIPLLLRQAWDEFHHDPAGYSGWERTQIESLWSALGF